MVKKKYKETAYIVHPQFSGEAKALSGPVLRDEDLVQAEAVGLAYAIGLEVASVRSVNVSRIHAGSFLGKGTRESIAQDLELYEPDIVIFNHNLSPVQQRNLEKEWGAKVIDRTGLILEIFGARAQTKEGRLQVELAAQEYQRSRLVRSWTHLERQRGGAGFMGGPGERQIEIDRRLIDQRITKLRRELAEVRRTRELGRKSRERVPFPVVAIVGYTNAGKSTLFNTLTQAGVFAEDLPFATLDPTMRRYELPNGQTVILSDTVGFISDLPTHLVESFRATLEQVNYADVIFHVVDIARPDFEAQRHDVIKVLGDLGIAYEEDDRIIEIWNKADAVPEDRIEDVRRLCRFMERPCFLISAQTGEGIAALMQSAMEIISKERVTVRFLLPFSDGKAIAWLYSHGHVQEQSEQGERIEISVMMEPRELNRFKKHFGYTEHMANAAGKGKRNGRRKS